jgi:type IX secretion system PorP/SprF family membrane protein
MKGFVKYSLILYVVMSFNSSTLWAQGFHFSQYFNAPLYTNPANTGFIPESDYRIGAHHRTQGATGLSIYKTNALYGDMQILREKIASGWVGIGGMILQDQAGIGRLRSTKISASVAYHQMLGFSSLLSGGFGLAYADKAISIDRLTFSDQWNGRFFESKTPILGAQFNGQYTAYFDLSAGFNYAYFPNDNFYLHSGLSLQHVNRPKESFFDYSDDSTRIAMRTTFFLDAMYKVDNRIILSPGIYYSGKSKTSEFLFGTHANLNVSGNGRQQLIVGLYSRVGDAVIPVVGYQWGRFKFTFTFDIPSTRKKVINQFNGTELYLQYGGMYSVMSIKNHTMCPSFDE